ncbi:hypothetical protein Bbelb_083330 [Branchiostoma belcheri]|nr:hypothetical protein Bbelb_083330 [Branchiostoma belcheri]
MSHTKDSDAKPNKYENVSPNGESFVSSSGLQRAVCKFKELPTHHHTRMDSDDNDAKMSHTKDLEAKDQNKYENVDPNGESFVLSSGRQRAVSKFKDLSTLQHEGMDSEINDAKMSHTKDPEEEDHKYEDVDLDIESGFGLSSGQQRAVSRFKELPTRHHMRTDSEVNDAKMSHTKDLEAKNNRYKNVGPNGERPVASSGLQCAVSKFKELPTRHHTRMDFEVNDAKMSHTKDLKAKNNKYKNVGPNGERPVVTSGLQRAVSKFKELPSRQHEKMDSKVNDAKMSHTKDPEEENNKHEDVDLDGESGFALSSRLQRAVPTGLPTRHHEGMKVTVDVNYLPENELEHVDRKHKDVDAGHGRVSVRMGRRGATCKFQRAAPTDTSLHHIDMGDHIVECPEHDEDLRHDNAYTQKDTEREEEPEEDSVNYRVGDCAIGMWKKVKSTKVCWFAPGCCLLVIAVVLAATIIAPRLVLTGKVVNINGTVIKENLTVSDTPSLCEDVFHNPTLPYFSRPTQGTAHDAEGFTTTNSIFLTTTGTIQSSDTSYLHEKAAACSTLNPEVPGSSPDMPPNLCLWERHFT